MSAITTHVLDTSRGRPAAGIRVVLEIKLPDGTWNPLGSGITDADGRLRTLLSVPLEEGTYRLTFHTAAYSTFYPEASVTFTVLDKTQHYHVPLLLSPYGYTTYRGS